MKNTDEIEDLRRDLDAAKSRYLRSHGWHCTSDTPGCLWLWRKATPNGETLLVEESTALMMQRHWCDESDF